MQTETTRRLSDVTAAQALIIVVGTLLVAFILTVSATLLFPSTVMNALETIAKANPAYTQTETRQITYTVLDTFEVNDLGGYQPFDGRFELVEDAQGNRSILWYYWSLETPDAAGFVFGDAESGHAKILWTGSTGMSFNGRFEITHDQISGVTLWHLSSHTPWNMLYP